MYPPFIIYCSFIYCTVLRTNRRQAMWYSRLLTSFCRTLSQGAVGVFRCRACSIRKIVCRRGQCTQNSEIQSIQVANYVNQDLDQVMSRPRPKSRPMTLSGPTDRNILANFPNSHPVHLYIRDTITHNSHPIQMYIHRSRYAYPY